MLLRSVKAVNFLGFAEVEIPNLPSRGVVAVEGAESREHRAIRDLISFALFGRSTEGAAPPEQLITPGAEFAYVELALTHSSAGNVSLLRGVDRSGATKVSLREAQSGELRNRQGEVAERVVEILGLDADGFERVYLSPARQGSPLPGEVTSESDLPELRRERKRVKARLGRARERLAKLESGPEGRAGAQVAALRVELAEEWAAVDPGPLLAEVGEAAEAVGVAYRREAARREVKAKEGELEELCERLCAERVHADLVVGEAAAERQRLRQRLVRVNEYGVCLEELRSAMLSASVDADAGRPEGDLGRRVDSVNPRRSLLTGVLLTVAAMVLVGVVLVMQRILDESEPWVGAVSGLLTVVIFIDLYIAARAYVAYWSSRRHAPRRGDVPLDPVPLLERIEREYADVVPDYDPELPARLQTTLGELEARVEAVMGRRQRVDRILSRIGESGTPAGEAARAVDPLSEVDLESIEARAEEIHADLEAAARHEPGGLPPDRARAALADSLSRLLDAAGEEGRSDELLRRLGLGSGREGGLPDTFAAALGEEVERLGAAANERSATRAKVLMKRLCGAEEAMSRLLDVRERVRRAEAELARVEHRIGVAREAGADIGVGEEAALTRVADLLPRCGYGSFDVEEGAFVGVDSSGSHDAIDPGSALGRTLGLAVMLERGRRTLSTLRDGPRFVVLEEWALGRGPEDAKDLLRYVQGVDEDTTQVIVLAPPGQAPEGSDLLAVAEEGGGEWRISAISRGPGSRT
ncbi:MAG: hypothetical protein ACYTDY_01765 [Planctomycetota bacterium]|jgi:hypothetical protein